MTFGRSVGTDRHRQTRTKLSDIEREAQLTYRDRHINNRVVYYT